MTAEFRAQGSQKSQEIRSKADRDVTVLVAEATSKSEQVRGEGDGERNRIFAEAFGKDVDFFTFYRSMQAYEAGMRHNDTRMVLSPDSEFFRYFVDPSGKSRDSSQGSSAGLRAVAPPATAEIAIRRHQQRVMVGGNVRLSGRDRSGVRHRGDFVRRLPGAGEAGDGACHGDGRQRLAADRHRVRRYRRGAGLAGSGLSGGEAAFPPQSAGSVLLTQVLMLGPSLGAPEVPCVRPGVDALSNQQLFPGDLTAMARLITVLAHAVRQPALSVIAVAALALSTLTTPTFARGPENIADVAEKVIDAVVNISTSQKVGGVAAVPADSRRAAAPAGLAVRGVLRGVLQEPPRPGRRRADA